MCKCNTNGNNISALRAVTAKSLVYGTFSHMLTSAKITHSGELFDRLPSVKEKFWKFYRKVALFPCALVDHRFSF